MAAAATAGGFITRRDVITGTGNQRSGTVATELTPRQQEVLAMLADGATNAEIARRLGVRLDTVKLHVRDVYRRAGVRGRVGAMRFARMLPEASPAADQGKPLLSERELEVLRLVAEGRRNREVAATLVISPNTVKFHLRRIYAKLGVENRVEAAGWLYDRQNYPFG